MLEKNILLVVMKEHAVVDLNEAQENYKAALQLTKGRRYASLVDGLAFVTITSEAREFANQPAMYENIIAQAIVATSTANRLLANFLIKFHRRNKSAELKLFSTYELALSWLKQKTADEEKKR